MGKNKEMKQAPNKRRVMVTIISCLLVICMCIGMFAQYVNIGLFDVFVKNTHEHNEGYEYDHNHSHSHDDTVYLVEDDLMMNGEVLFENVTIEGNKLILADGYVLMENVTVDPDGTLYGKVNPIEN